MTAWSTAPLGELCHVTGGGTPSRTNTGYFGGGIPWVKIGDMLQGHVTSTEETISSSALQNSAAKLLPPGTVLISIFATIGRTAVLDVEAATNQAIAGIIPLDPTRLSPEYLRQFLDSVAPSLERRARGVAQANINFGILKALPVPLPPLAEQRRIAEVLDRAEALRATRRAALAQLDALTQSIFLDLFGDPLENPKRWPDPTLGGLLTFQQYGPRFFNESYSSHGIRIVRITDLDETGALAFSDMPRLVVSDADREKYALRPGDLIFARSGATVGKVALIQPHDPPCIAGAYFITMRFAESLDPIYARAVLTAPSVRAIVARRSRQAAQQNFSGPGLRRLPMPLPPLNLQHTFARRVASVEKLKAAHCVSLAELDALFASLQHRAFRGEL